MASKPIDTGTRGLAPNEALELTEDPTTKEAYWKNGLLAREVGFEDREGLDAFFRERDEAIDNKRFDVLSAQEDHPVFVISDTSKGRPVADAWDEKRYPEVMGRVTPYFPKDVSLIHEDRQYLFLTNDLVISVETNAFVLNGERVTWKAANVLVRRDGKWKNKGIIEGGLGDFMLLQGLITG